MTASRGSQLERYDLVERIAVGGMAEVFLAKAHGAHGFEKTLAIKRILPELARDREFEDNFISEAKLAVRLTHANIVQVFDFGRFGGTLFLAMEYVDGLDLAALLQRFRERGRMLPLPAAFHIAVEIARGLDFAHKHGVVHRDVSPSNILLSRAGEVKIADFGIAVPDAQGLRAPARKRRIMGKWRYMSPEQTRGEDVGTRSDLFSAATVMFELFTGEKLFPGDEPETIVHNIRTMEIPNVCERRSGLPPRLDSVLREALARDPGERPARAAELQRVLAELSYESSIVATALDVAEAVTQVLEPEEAEPRTQRPSQPLALDALIRQQLGLGKGSTERRTAVNADARPAAKIPAPAAAAAAAAAGEAVEASTPAARPGAGRPATIVKTGVGKDGLTVWDFGDGEPVPEDAGPGNRSALLHARNGAQHRGLVAPVAGTPGRRAPLIVAVLALVAVVMIAFASSRLLAPPVVVALPPDAAPPDAAPAPVPEVVGSPLFVLSTPPGAQVWIDGELLEERTPAVARVRANEPHRVELALEGYERHVQEGVIVPPDKPERVTVTLQAKQRVLVINTTPSGALVRLSGRKLGTTPLSVGLTADELASRRNHVLTLSKEGYQTVTISPLTLTPGKPTTIQRTLEPAPATPRYGTIQIHIENSWAEVYFKDQKIGRAPVESLRLPVGRHRLRLYNPISKRETTLDVDVAESQQRYYRVEL